MGWGAQLWPAPIPTLLTHLRHCVGTHLCFWAPLSEARPTPMVPGAQEEEERDESGCEEEEGREDEDEDSGSEESLVDSDSDPEEKGAWAWAVGCGGCNAWLPVPKGGVGPCSKIMVSRPQHSQT